ncbi:MAG TPA: hypothetical protein VHQ90_03695 [Thermoanaerobaculia bacterium]|nr:hypothetical protein [Thermoanaerobaculia bacterium]
MRAPLVSAAPPRVLATPADGMIAALELRAGAGVAASKVLAVLDSPPLRSRLRQARSRREALRLEVAAVADQVRAARTALAEDALAAEAQGVQLAAEQRRAAAAAGLADRERRRRALFEAAGLLSAAEAERSRAEAEQLAATAEALSFACWAGGRARRALLDQAARDEARLRGESALAAPSWRRLRLSAGYLVELSAAADPPELGGVRDRERSIPGFNSEAPT